VRELAEVNGWGCLYCDEVLTERTAQIDHVIPQSKGGSDDISNLALACAFCNRSKGARSADEYRAIVRDREANKPPPPRPVSPGFQAVIDFLSGKTRDQS
jgi:5-methylcytosine-specific restriction endonuclease McrA